MHQHPQNKPTKLKAPNKKTQKKTTTTKRHITQKHQSPRKRKTSNQHLKHSTPKTKQIQPKLIRQTQNINYTTNKKTQLLTYNTTNYQNKTKKTKKALLTIETTKRK